MNNRFSFNWLLPKPIENDKNYNNLIRFFTHSSKPLWRKSQILIPETECSSFILNQLRSAASSQRIIRGFDSAKKILDLENKGLQALRSNQNQIIHRVSRLLILANDGAERFYRHVETLLTINSPRVMAIRLQIDGKQLGEYLFGKNEMARLVLITHKDAVTRFFLEGICKTF